MAGAGPVSGGTSVSSPPNQSAVSGASSSAGGGSPSSAMNQASAMNQQITFPSDLVSSSSGLYMTIGFQEYVRRSIFDKPFLSPIGGISLPIPDNLSDQQSIRYEEVQGGLAVGAAIEQALRSKNDIKNNIRQGNYSAAAGDLAKIGAIGTIGGIGGVGMKAIDAAASKFVGAQQASAQLLQLGGLSTNPFLTVLFKQPTFKTHQFSWRLLPRNAGESEAVAGIINQMRYNMLPGMLQNSGGTLLKYPNMANISFSEDTYLYKFKPCVLESVTFDFTGTTNIPSFFKGTGAPVSVRINAVFKEIEYWLQEDIMGDRSAGAANFSSTPNQVNGQNLFVG